MAINLNIKESLKLGNEFSPQGQVAGRTYRLAKKVAAGTGAIFGAVALYFLALGKAALTGFLIGAGIGGAAGAVGGAIIGAQAGAAIGTLILPGPGTIIGGAIGGALGGSIGLFVGGTIGGVTGGLIALGLASGSATTVSMGVGAGFGGTIGAVVGYTAFTAGYAILVGACAAVFAPCAALAVLTPAVGGIGAVVGGYVGAMAGAAVGYYVGKYVIEPVKNAVSNTVITVKSGFGGMGSGIGIGSAGIGSALGAVGSFFTGLASSIWGGMVSAGGGILSGLSSIGGAIFGGLSSASTATLASVSVFGSIGTIGIVGTIVGVATAATFFNPDAESNIVPGQNQYFTIEKTVNTDQIQNDRSTTLRFTIKLTAKDKKLTEIHIVSDKINITGPNSNFSQDQTLAPCANLTELQPNASWSCPFNFRLRNDNGNFNDSHLTNTVTISAIPEGTTNPIQDSAIAAVTIGHPPTNCPSGWPTDTGFITQGPEGVLDHARLLRDYGESAIDIGDNLGTPTFATFNGTVVDVVNWDDGHYGIHVDIQGTCGNTTFKARWAHLNDINPAIVNGGTGTPVNFHDLIGHIDSTGNSTGNHLHYSFFGLSMAEPYIPKTPNPLSCSDDPGQTPCGISW